MNSPLSPFDEFIGFPPNDHPTPLTPLSATTPQADGSGSRYSSHEQPPPLLFRSSAPVPIMKPVSLRRKVLSQAPSSNAAADEDHSVIKTNDEAAVCKLTLTDLDYVRDDPYISHFVKSAPSRSPLINRGYFARVHCIRQLLDDFYRLFAPMNQPQQ
jgi:hypothetical protein